MTPTYCPASSHTLALYTSAMQRFLQVHKPTILFRTNSFYTVPSALSPEHSFLLPPSLLYCRGNYSQACRAFSTYLLKEEAFLGATTPFLLPEFCISPPSPRCNTGSHALLGQGGSLFSMTDVVVIWGVQTRSAKPCGQGVSEVSCASISQK